MDWTLLRYSALLFGTTVMLTLAGYYSGWRMEHRSPSNSWPELIIELLIFLGSIVLCGWRLDAISREGASFDETLFDGPKRSGNYVIPLAGFALGWLIGADGIDDLLSNPLGHQFAAPILVLLLLLIVSYFQAVRRTALARRGIRNPDAGS